MNVISRKALTEFEYKHSTAKQALNSWYYMMEKNTYPDPDSIKKVFRSVDFLSGDRLVFNIKGNSYRIIVKIRYSTQTMFIRFIGTHAEYDKVNAEKI
jgi:mRNA interferase HigB